MTERPLDSDTLGDLGEKEFGALCARANLIANVANRDRAGWDYIIDFRLETGLQRLDVRPAPASARVQVKTQWADRDVVKLRLSSAEQLVKHNGPSLICILSVDDALRFTRMRIIHCRGNFLSRVLKRLRLAEVRGERPNDVQLSIRPSAYAEAVAPDHRALQSALEALRTTAPLAYLTAKDAELKTLGFEQNSMELKVGFSGTEDEIVDGFLGLRPIEARTLTATQTRFGITLPMTDLPGGPAIVRFEPRPDRCDVIFRTRDATFRFRGRAFRPPAQVNAAATRPKILIRTDILRIEMISERRPPEISLKLTIGIDSDLPDDVKLKPEEWRDAYGVLAGFTAGGVEMEVRQGRNHAFRQTFKDETAASGPQWRKLSRLTASASFAFERAGAPNAKVSLQELWDAGDEITTMSAIARDPEMVTGVSFVTPLGSALPRPEPVTMLLGHAFRVGEHVLAYGAKLIVTGVEDETEVVWSSRHLVLLGMQRVKSERAFRTFLDGLPPQPYRMITGVYQAKRLPNFGLVEAAVPMRR